MNSNTPASEDDDLGFALNEIAREHKQKKEAEQAEEKKVALEEKKGYDFFGDKVKTPFSWT